jgi:formiminotetrahydrofolate cyclodeaminase
MSERRVIAGKQVDALLGAMASDQSEPGGGAFAALAAAAGAALIAGVARQTIHRGGSDATKRLMDRMGELAAEADAARTIVLALADVEAETYQRVVAAYRLPHEGDAERAARLHELQGALEATIDAQLELARRSVYLLGLAEEVTESGNPNAAADGMAAAAGLHAATIASLANVESNAFAIVDDERRSELLATCSSLRERAALMLGGVAGAYRKLAPG